MYVCTAVWSCVGQSVLYHSTAQHPIRMYTMPSLVYNTLSAPAVVLSLNHRRHNATTTAVVHGDILVFICVVRSRRRGVSSSFVDSKKTSVCATVFYAASPLYIRQLPYIYASYEPDYYINRCLVLSVLRGVRYIGGASAYMYTSYDALLVKGTYDNNEKYNGRR